MPGVGATKAARLATYLQTLLPAEPAPRRATDWEELPLDTAMDMIADRVIAGRRDSWEDVDGSGNSLRRTLAFAHLGGATLDNEENYLIKKLFTALGAIQIENQARI